MNQYFRTVRVKPISMFDVRGRIIIFLIIVITTIFVIIVSSHNWSIPFASGFYKAASIFNQDFHFSGISTISSSNDTAADNVYGIMFDAGSTGSRIHIFQFQFPKPGAPLQLVKEIFKQTKPGLSAYVASPLQAAASLEGMLDEAFMVIPKNAWKKTPIALKATAGLRLLGDKEADRILSEVASLFRKLPFLMINTSIQIMSGMDEGVFSWITVNFLLGNMRKGHQTVAALDLGGGSTQLTFVPQNEITVKTAPKGYIKQINLLGSSYMVYTHSYLGLGLMSARLQMMSGNKTVSLGNSEKLTSPCLPPDFQDKWTNGGKTFVVRGSEGSVARYESCYRLTELTIAQHNVKVVEELSNLKIFAFSYFYDSAVVAGLISDAGGSVTIKQFHDAANTVCAMPKSKFPFLCMDLIYIYSLLHDGYRLPEKTVLTLNKKIDGVEISWALGATFQLFSSVGLMT